MDYEDIADSSSETGLCVTTTTITTITPICRYGCAAYAAHRHLHPVINTFAHHINAQYYVTLKTNPPVKKADIGTQVGTPEVTDDSIDNGSSIEYNTTKEAYYNLTTLSRAALLDIIYIFNQCLCLWHKPTQLRVGNKDIICGYQLILAKLQEHQKGSTLYDARNIIYQLMNDFHIILNTPRQSKETSMRYSKSVLETSINKLQSATARKVIERLMFLTCEKENDLRRADINKLCGFCNKGFCTYGGLWKHMKGTHIVLETYQTDLDVKNRNDEFGPFKYCADRGQLLNPTVAQKKKCKLHKPAVKVNQFQRNRFRHDTTSGESDMEIRPEWYFLQQFSDNFLLRFISSLRQKECLWKVNSEEYRNRHRKEQAYIEMLRECHDGSTSYHSMPNIFAVKNIIRLLKYYYRRNRSCVANRRLLRYYIWEKMDFLEEDQQRQYPRYNYDRQYHYNDSEITSVSSDI